MSHLDGDVYFTLHSNICVYQSLNQLKFINASYDTYCEEYLLKLKTKFYEIIQLCMIHRSIYDLIKSEIPSEILYFYI